MIDWKAPLRECRICPRACGIDRTAGKRGFCGAGALVRVARTMLHRWEEPCLIGAHGAGAVFFSHCTLRCVYCQNHEIRHGKRGDLVVAYGMPKLVSSKLRWERIQTLD
ncbi:MAG: radical SAM protein, partial [Selenomonas artemidis]